MLLIKLARNYPLLPFNVKALLIICSKFPAMGSFEGAIMLGINDYSSLA